MNKLMLIVKSLQEERDTKEMQLISLKGDITALNEAIDVLAERLRAHGQAHPHMNVGGLKEPIGTRREVVVRVLKSAENGSLSVEEIRQRMAELGLSCSFASVEAVLSRHSQGLKPMFKRVATRTYALAS